MDEILGNNNPQATKTGTTIWSIFSCLVLLAITLCSFWFAYNLVYDKPDKEKGELIFISIQDLINKKEQLTDQQWDEYEKTIIGKRIHWTGSIDEIGNDFLGDNTVYIDLDNPPDGHYEVSFKYPEEKTIGITKGQKVTFEGDIEFISGVVGTSVKLTYPEIISP